MLLKSLPSGMHGCITWWMNARQRYDRSFFFSIPNSECASLIPAFPFFFGSGPSCTGRLQSSPQKDGDPVHGSRQPSPSRASSSTGSRTEAPGLDVLAPWSACGTSGLDEPKEQRNLSGDPGKTIEELKANQEKKQKKKNQQRTIVSRLFFPERLYDSLPHSYLFFCLQIFFVPLLLQDSTKERAAPTQPHTHTTQ